MLCSVSDVLHRSDHRKVIEIADDLPVPLTSPCSWPYHLSVPSPSSSDHRAAWSQTVRPEVGHVQAPQAVPRRGHRRGTRTHRVCGATPLATAAAELCRRATLSAGRTGSRGERLWPGHPSAAAGRCRHLGARVPEAVRRWQRTSPAVRRTLLRSSDGAIRWTCPQPSARATVECEGRTFDGFGYAERLSIVFSRTSEHSGLWHWRECLRGQGRLRRRARRWAHAAAAGERGDPSALSARVAYPASGHSCTGRQLADRAR